MPPRVAVVIDSNVWIGGLLSRTGAPAELTRRVVLAGLPFFSPATLDELRTRLWKPKFDRYLSLARRQRFLIELAAVALTVDIPVDIAQRRDCRDPDDDKFLHTALAAGARWLIRGDADLLVLADAWAASGVRIVSPAAALLDKDFLVAR